MESNSADRVGMRRHASGRDKMGKARRSRFNNRSPELKSWVCSVELRYREQTCAYGGGAWKFGHVDAKTRDSDQMACQRQIGDAQRLAVAACDARRELRFVSDKTLAKPVCRPGKPCSLIRSELFGQSGLDARNHERMRVRGG